MEKQILELRKKGYSYKMIQNELKCSKSTISYYCGKNQKEKAYKRIKKQRETHPWLKKQEHFIKRYKNKNITNDAKYFDRKKIQEYLDTVDTCYLTGRMVNTSDVTSYEFDHILPLSRGGNSSFENLGIVTPEANRAKSDMTVKEFIKLCKDVLKNFGYKVTKNK